MSGSMQHSLQYVLLTFGKVSKKNWQSIQNFVETNGFECRINYRYAKTLFFKLCYC